MKSPLVCTMVAALALPVAAQQTLDRTKIPPPAPPPQLHVPVWTKTTLPNGAELIVSEKHDLPLVSFRITFQGGADQFEQANRRGVGSLTAAMLSEGTKTRDGEALSNALQLLGTSIRANVGGESGSLEFLSTTAKFPQTLDILADMLLNSTFPDRSLERLRAQRLVALEQAKAQPEAVARRVYPILLYGGAHPYGQPITEDTVKAITRDDVVAFDKTYFQPGRALITVVGDVTAASVKPAIEKALADWPKGGDEPSFKYPAVPNPSATTIYIVDKPAAAQSMFLIGNPGPPRNTPDYYALQVMNTILGGMFQSRLNSNIREQKGYSYGVNSVFQYGKGPGPFYAGGDIVSAKTAPALTEFMKELKGIEGARPVTDGELTMAKDSLVQRLPGEFASVGAINNAITSLWVQGLPDDYYQQYGKAIDAISRDDVVRVAKHYIDLGHLTILIVGDRASIEAPLEATGIAPIKVVDINGQGIKP
ncbi:MAG TPA: pitrilysin family protein [Vicinamibacterales bacterium]|nr:pitrilysin family protein [Vicinamibacterales bacterium]